MVSIFLCSIILLHCVTRIVIYKFCVLFALKNMERKQNLHWQRNKQISQLKIALKKCVLTARMNISRSTKSHRQREAWIQCHSNLSERLIVLCRRNIQNTQTTTNMMKGGETTSTHRTASDRARVKNIAVLLNQYKKCSIKRKIWRRNFWKKKSVKLKKWDKLP